MWRIPHEGLRDGWSVGCFLVNERLVWIDCEMTGLDFVNDALVEIAAVVTDYDLTVLGDGIDLVIKPPAEALATMDDFVRTMHESSGLLTELDSGITLEEAQEQVLAYVREHCAEGSRPPLAGNTVGTDRAFISRDMPDLDAFLHYRIVDVSSIKELARRWYPDSMQGLTKKPSAHRAMDDIKESVAELAYWRERVFRPTTPTPSEPST